MPSAVAGPHASHAKMTCALCRVAAVADLLSNIALFDERQVAGRWECSLVLKRQEANEKILMVHFFDVILML